MRTDSFKSRFFLTRVQNARVRTFFVAKVFTESYAFVRYSKHWNKDILNARYFADIDF